MADKQQDQIFNEWIKSHKGIFFKVVRSYAHEKADREDLFQEIAVQVWRSIPSFRGDSSETTWIYRIALNTALKWRGKEHKHQEGKQNLNVANQILVDQSEKSDPRLVWLYEQIAGLDKVDRSLCLLLLDGFSYKEMAKILGISESYVGVKINRIKSYLSQRTQNIQ